MKTMTRRPVPDNNLIKSVRKLGPLCGLSGPALVIVLLFSWFLASCGTVSKQSQPLPPDFGLSTRSEEHTSELQSHSDLVCRLLLEKKNNKNIYTAYTSSHRNSETT